MFWGFLSLWLCCSRIVWHVFYGVSWLCYFAFLQSSLSSTAAVRSHARPLLRRLALPFHLQILMKVMVNDLCGNAITPDDLHEDSWAFGRLRLYTSGQLCELPQAHLRPELCGRLCDQGFARFALRPLTQGPLSLSVKIGAHAVIVAAHTTVLPPAGERRVCNAALFGMVQKSVCRLCRNCAEKVKRLCYACGKQAYITVRNAPLARGISSYRFCWVYEDTNIFCGIATLSLPEILLFSCLLRRTWLRMHAYICSNARTHACRCRPRLR